MNKNIKTAIITYVDDNVLENLERDFLETLRKNALYKGRVFVIYYGKKIEEIRKIAEKYKADIFFAKNIFRVSNQRNIDIARLLKKLPQEIEQVMCIDGGDVWFQAPIDEVFETTKNGYGFVEENNIASSGFNLSCLEQIKDKRIRDLFFEKAKGLELINSGMIAGEKTAVLNILKRVADLTLKINQDFFALDQSIFNYVVRSDGRGINLPENYNYPLGVNKNKFIIKDKLFYNQNNKIINVVHNLGNEERLLPQGRKSIVAIPEITAKTPRIFCGINKRIFLKIDYLLGIMGFAAKKFSPVFYKAMKRMINNFDENSFRKILSGNWFDYKNDFFPKDRRMEVLGKNGVDGLTSENIKFLINEIVRKFCPQGVYLEVGIWKGCSLISASLFNPLARCIGIDDFSEFNDGRNEEILQNNLAKFPGLKAEYYKGDYRKVIKDVFLKEPSSKVDVYFYDGNHSYENQLEGLKTVKPYLAKNCLIIVDDVNWERVEKANSVFLSENPDFKSILKIKTKGNASEDWWNGIEIIGRI